MISTICMLFRERHRLKLALQIFTKHPFYHSPQNLHFRVIIDQPENVLPQLSSVSQGTHYDDLKFYPNVLFFFPPQSKCS